jgi:hypothetical protein
VNNVVQNITMRGKIVFDVPNVTRKHNRQADWKRIAMVVFEDDTAEYYSWFIKRRYGITLNKPLRGPHITFVNDSVREIKGGDEAWEEVRKKWDGKEIEVTLNLDVRTNIEYWWLRASSESFNLVREELGIGEPYFSYHMTIGFPNERNIEQSEYIHNLIMKFGGEYN